MSGDHQHCQVCGDDMCERVGGELLCRVPAAGGLEYLASPYSHPDPAVRQARFEAVCRAAGQLIQQGHLVFSPIAHSHHIPIDGATEEVWRLWMNHGMKMIARCDRLRVLMLDGWRESVGVAAEIEEAEREGLPIEYMPAPDGFGYGEQQ